MLRAIPGFPGYEADSRGWVVSLKSGRRMSEWIDRHGYAHVPLSINRTRRSPPTRLAVHVAVCLAFHGPRPAATYQVRHLDGNRRNNAYPNLRWGTPADNGSDTRRHGTQRGAQNGNARLTPGLANSIRTNYGRGMSQNSIAGSFGVSQSHVSRIVRGEAWARP